MADDPIVEQRPHGSELRLARHLRVDAMQLPEPDLLHAELLAASDGLAAEIVRIAMHLPRNGTGAPEAGLGRDQEALIGIKGLADQFFGDVGTVGIGGIDEIDAELRHAPQGSERSFAVGGKAPNSWPSHAHGAEAEPADLELSDFERTGPSCI